MTCPRLEYRESNDEHEFDRERAYCTVLGTFVSPMKADICNNRSGFHHAEDCDVFREGVER